MKQLWISAGLVAQPGKSPADVRQALQALQRSTINETGCIRFDVLQHRDSPRQFTLWEGWVDETALESHFNSAHTLAYLAQELTTVRYVERLSAPASATQCQTVTTEACL